MAHAVVAAPLLLAGALALALLLPRALLLVLGAYFAMTMAYSLRLKRQVIVDVLLLAALYTMRLLAGAVATAVVPSVLAARLLDVPVSQPGPGQALFRS